LRLERKQLLVRRQSLDWVDRSLGSQHDPWAPAYESQAPRPLPLSSRLPEEPLPTTWQRRADKTLRLTTYKSAWLNRFERFSSPDLPAEGALLAQRPP
jgi:hypothetical protein